MQAKTLTTLSVLTVAAVAIAIASSFSKPGSINTADRGKPVFPDLVTNANTVAEVTIDAGDWEAHLRRDGEGFIDDSGYPARLEPIRTIITGLATLTYEEAKTAEPDRYNDLELDDPSEAVGAGRLVTLSAAGKPLASLIVGDSDLTVGGRRGGLFARLPDDPQTWLLRGAVDLPGSRGDLFDAQLLGWNTNDVAAMTVNSNSPAATLSFVSTDAGAPLNPVNLPAGQQTDNEKVLALGALVNNLRFGDVRKAVPDSTTDGAVSYETRNGVRLTIERLSLTDGAPANAERWVRFSVAATDQADEQGRQQIAQLASKVDGYDFTLYDSTYDTLSQTPASLTSNAPAQD